MSDEPDNIVLQQLELVRRQVNWIGEKLDRLVDDVDNLQGPHDRRGAGGRWRQPAA
jgi:hypothetical protein